MTDLEKERRAAAALAMELAHHLTRMLAAKATIPVSIEGVEFVVTVERKQ